MNDQINALQILSPYKLDKFLDWGQAYIAHKYT